MVEVSVSSRTTVVRSQVVLQTVQVTDDLFLFRRVDSGHDIIEHQGDLAYPREQQTKENICEGSIDAKNLQNMKKGKPFKTCNFVIASSELIENIRLYGWHLSFANEFNRPAFIVDGYSQVRQDVFAAIVTDKVSLSNLIFLDHSRFMARRYDGEFLPVGMTFNYINGNIDETHFDLEKAAEHLLTRTDVVVYAGRSLNMRKSEFAIATTPKEALMDIPYYSATNERSLQLSFRWAPSVEDYRKMVTAIDEKNLGLTNLFYEEVFKQDLLGLRKIGAILKEPYYYD